jgi:hypothetical protein
MKTSHNDKEGDCPRKHSNPEKNIYICVYVCVHIYVYISIYLCISISKSGLKNVTKLLTELSTVTVKLKILFRDKISLRTIYRRVNISCNRIEELNITNNQMGQISADRTFYIEIGNRT